MPEETISTWIARLSHKDADERADAAHELFRFGCAMAEPVLRRWLANADFRALARSGSSLLTVGIAVEPHRFEGIRKAFGEPKLADAPADQDVIEFELEFAHGVRLDILTTRAPEGGGAIARFLSRSGEGVQQVECDVRDVVSATEVLRKQLGVEPIYPEVHSGANGTRVNFFLVPAAENRKVLIELVEVSVPVRKKRK